LLNLAADLPEAPREGRLWRIPVVYGGEFGIDLEETARRLGLTSAELVRRHAAPVYRVFMGGFLPGFAYLGGLDPTIATPRRATPRTWTPAGTISIGGVQALIASNRGAERLAPARPHARAQFPAPAGSRVHP
jgi:5-oxoprolinase (ATP-hydrolysing) subunit B